MRVVGGAWRGRPLQSPAGRATRPTSDKVREAMFDVLGALPAVRRAPAGRGLLAGHAALDVFAGSGALGIEALSRGADSCTFVESASAALRALHANLDRLGVAVERPASVAAARGAKGSDAATEPPGELPGFVGPPTESSGGPLEKWASEPNAARPPCAVVLAADVRRALAADARRQARYTLVFADPPYDLYEQIRPALVRLLGRVLVPGAVLVVESAAGTAAGLPWTVLREKRYGDTRVTFLVAGDAPPAEGEAPE